jgi:membrane-associated protease RseP (regulator of RpoE activity)
MSRETKTILIQAGLFIATLITTTFAGAEWVYSKSIFAPEYSWQDFQSGFAFSIPLLLILTCHEFGHYFVALYHRVKTSLPYYIPIPPNPFFISFGTFGAVIRLRERPRTTTETFDIGIAGPIAGFVVAVALLIYGYKTLPPADYIYQFHPEYRQYGRDYADYVYNDTNLKPGQVVVDLKIGKSLLVLLAEKLVDDPSRIPNEHEIMHYPILFAVCFGLFVTSLNLLPIGQLDGGHVVYGLFGYKKHRAIASVFFIALMFYAGLNNPYIQLTLPKTELITYTLIYIVFLYIAFLALGVSKRDTLMYALIVTACQFLIAMTFPNAQGYSPWLLLGFLLAKLVGIQHPPSEIEQPLDTKRITLGWISLLIFALCFSPVPLDPELLIGK